MNHNYNFRVVLKLFIFMLVHLGVLGILIGLLGWTQLPFVLLLLMSIDELLLCGQPGKIIAKRIFETEDVPALARVGLLVYNEIVRRGQVPARRYPLGLGIPHGRALAHFLS